MDRNDRWFRRWPVKDWHINGVSGLNYFHKSCIRDAFGDEDLMQIKMTHQANFDSVLVINLKKHFVSLAWSFKYNDF